MSCVQVCTYSSGKNIRLAICAHKPLHTKKQKRGAGSVVRCVQLPLVVLASYLRVPVQILTALLPASVSGKAASNGLDTRVPASHVGDADAVPSSWLLSPY